MKEESFVHLALFLFNEKQSPIKTLQMKKTILPFAFFFCFILAFSQDKNFDLSKYKLPNIKRHKLQLSFNSNGNQNNYTEEDELIYNSHSEYRSFDVKKSHFNTKIDLLYNYFFNTKEKIVISETQFSPTYKFQKEKTEDTKDSYYQPEITFKTSTDISIFLNDKNVFINIIPELNFKHSKDQSKINGETNYKHIYNSLETSIGLGIGKGRLEPVSDLWQSYFILKNLENDGLLNRTLKESDIFEFATKSSKLKNKRFFDYRLRKIEELKTLDSLLHNQQLITNSDINYFTILNDYWSFANIWERHSGNVMKLISTPRYISWNQKNMNKHNDDESFFDLVSKINLTSSKQINLNWERNIWCEISSRNILNREEDTANDFMAGNFGVEYNYFPNFRTSIRSNLSFTAHESNVLFEGDITKKWKNEIRFYTSINYYISPQLRLSGSIGVSHMNRLNHVMTDLFNIGYHVNLSYAIF